MISFFPAKSNRPKNLGNLNWLTWHIAGSFGESADILYFKTCDFAHFLKYFHIFSANTHFFTQNFPRCHFTIHAIGVIPKMRSARGLSSVCVMLRPEGSCSIIRATCSYECELRPIFFHAYAGLRRYYCSEIKLYRFSYCFI